MPDITVAPIPAADLQPALPNRHSDVRLLTPDHQRSVPGQPTTKRCNQPSNRSRLLCPARSRPRRRCPSNMMVSLLQTPPARAATAVAALEDGAYTSTPVQTQFGWHVILRENSRESNPPTFESVRDSINQQVKQKKFEAHMVSLRASSKN